MNFTKYTHHIYIKAIYHICIHQKPHMQRKRSKTENYGTKKAIEINK